MKNLLLLTFFISPLFATKGSVQIISNLLNEKEVCELDYIKEKQLSDAFKLCSNSEVKNFETQFSNQKKEAIRLTLLNKLVQKILDESSKKCEEMKLHTDFISCIDFDPKTNQFLTGSDDKTVLYNQYHLQKNTKKVFYQMQAVDGVLDISGSALKHKIVVTCGEQGVMIWDKGLRQWTNLINDPNFFFRSAQYNEKSNTVLTVGEDMSVEAEDGDEDLRIVMLWDVQTNTKLWSTNPKQKIYDAQLDSTGKLFYLATKDGFEQWDTEKKQLVKKIEEIKGGIQALNQSPDGKYIIAEKRYDGNCIIDKEKFSIYRETFGAGFGDLLHSRLSNNNNISIETWDRGRILLTDIEKRVHLGRINLKEEISTPAVFGKNDQEILAGCDDGVLRIISLEKFHEKVAKIKEMNLTQMVDELQKQDK